MDKEKKLFDILEKVSELNMRIETVEKRILLLFKRNIKKIKHGEKLKY